MSQRGATIQVNGVEAVQAAIRAFGAQVEREAGKAIKATAVEVLSEVRDMIKHGPKTGREYPRRKGGTKIHRASAPGEAPASDTGALVGSTYIKQLDGLTWAIGSRFEYAFVLEFGWGPNKEGTKRPAWIPAVEKNIPRLEKRIRRVIAEARARNGGRL